MALLISVYLIIATSITIATTEMQYLGKCPVQCKCHMTTNTSHVTCISQSLQRIPNDIPKQVTYLDLHSNNISSLTNVFQNYTNVQHLDLSFNKIVELESLSFSELWNLKYLNLQSNSIPSLKPKTFNLPHLVVLNLANNSLKSINNAMFFGLLNLETINLHGNQISNVSENTFLFLETVTQLDLSNNKIRDLPDKIFDNLLHLEVLKLNGNMLQKLDGEMFSTNACLRCLELSHNLITQVNNVSLPCVQHLDLGYNNFSHFPSEGLQGMPNLTSFIFDGNPVSEITTPVFSNMSNLVNLSLSYMPNLYFISQQTFAGLENLQFLNLSHNAHMSFIHTELFSSVSSLIVLDLSHNNITTLYNGSLNTHTHLVSLDIRSNPLMCYCDLAWLIEDVKQNTSITQYKNELSCTMPNHSSVVPLVDMDVNLLHCSHVHILNYTQDFSVKIGGSARFICDATSFPNPEIIWITNRKRVLRYHNSHEYAIRGYLPVSDEDAHAKFHAQHDWHAQLSYYTETESRPDRITIMQDGSLYIDYVLRSDAGPYKCIAKNPRNSTSIVIRLTLDYKIVTEVKIWSLVFGFACAGTFFLLNLIYSLSMAAVRMCISQRRRARIRQILENMDQYKTLQLARIKENYNHQVGRIRDRYHYQLGRLREHQQNKMGRIRSGASLKVERLRDNYNNQLGKLKDYSSTQLFQIREKYNNQILKMKDYGSGKFERIHEKYRLQQQHVIKLLEMMNLDNCKTVFETECVRTESMILQSDLFTTEVPLHSPIDSVSVSDSEYLTATSAESSTHTSQENLHKPDISRHDGVEFYLELPRNNSGHSSHDSSVSESETVVGHGSSRVDTSKGGETDTTLILQADSLINSVVLNPHTRRTSRSSRYRHRQSRRSIVLNVEHLLHERLSHVSREDMMDIDTDIDRQADDVLINMPDGDKITWRESTV